MANHGETSRKQKHRKTPPPKKKNKRINAKIFSSSFKYISGLLEAMYRRETTKVGSPTRPNYSKNLFMFSNH